MDDSGIKRQMLKNKTSNIIQRDKREDTLESLIHNYSKDNKIKRKELLTKEEFFSKLT